MRSSHGGAGVSDAAGVGGVGGGDDAGAGGEDVDSGAVVAVGGLAPSRVDSANSQGVRDVGRRTLRGGDVVVARGGDGENALAEGGVDGRGPGSRDGAAEGQVDNGAPLAATGDNVIHGPGVAVQDHAGRPGDTGEHLDINEGGSLGDAKGPAAHGAGDMGAVAQSIAESATDGVVSADGAATELVVGDVNAAVNDVDPGTGTGRVIVPVGGRTRVAARDGAETVGGTCLADVGVKRVDRVRLDGSNLLLVSMFPLIRDGG